MDTDELVVILNKDLSMEYSLVIRYMIMANQLNSEEHGEVIEDLLTLSKESVSHSRLVSNEIRQLGGKPTTKITEFQYNPDIKAVLKASYSIEEKAMKSYEAVCLELGSGIPEKVFRRLAGDEKRHMKIIENMLAKLG